MSQLEMNEVRLTQIEEYMVSFDFLETQDQIEAEINQSENKVKRYYQKSESQDSSDNSKILAFAELNKQEALRLLGFEKDISRQVAELTIEKFGGLDTESLSKMMKSILEDKENILLMAKSSQVKYIADGESFKLSDTRKLELKISAIGALLEQPKAFADSVSNSNAENISKEKMLEDSYLADLIEEYKSLDKKDLENQINELFLRTVEVIYDEIVDGKILYLDFVDEDLDVEASENTVVLLKDFSMREIAAMLNILNKDMHAQYQDQIGLLEFSYKENLKGLSISSLKNELDKANNDLQVYCKIIINNQDKPFTLDGDKLVISNFFAFYVKSDIIDQIIYR